MKKLLLIICLGFPGLAFAQVTTIANDYKTIFIGDNGVGDYTKNLILLHECNISAFNYAVGTVTALRGKNGAYNRINVAKINSSSSNFGTSASLSTEDDFGSWKLKTCTFNGKTYLALEVPYRAAYHNAGYQFTGWVQSTGEAMVSVNFSVNNVPVNTSVLSNIQDFEANMTEHHFVNSFAVMGNVGIGTLNPAEKLSVNGNIRAKEVKVETANWPDYVFDQDYRNLGLQELDAYIKANKHLPEMPSAKEVETNGMALGELVKLQQKKIEELTLHLIAKDKDFKKLERQQSELEKKVEWLMKN